MDHWAQGMPGTAFEPLPKAFVEFEPDCGSRRTRTDLKSPWSLSSAIYEKRFPTIPEATEDFSEGERETCQLKVNMTIRKKLRRLTRPGIVNWKKLNDWPLFKVEYHVKSGKYLSIWVDTYRLSFIYLFSSNYYNEIQLCNIQFWYYLTWMCDCIVCECTQ